MWPINKSLVHSNLYDLHFSLWLLWLLLLLLIFLFVSFFILWSMSKSFTHILETFSSCQAIKLIRIANVYVSSHFILCQHLLCVCVCVCNININIYTTCKYLCLPSCLSVCSLARLVLFELLKFALGWSTSLKWVDFPVETHINEVEVRLKSFQLEQCHP